ncbi:hypothetical protein X801_02972 [Opisthorchis viverrini]|uniref:Uncharacterized protein n=2 Tax=Opisthorchis viverrini TaxID=6198 RepID=A0A075A3P2_OPIVI|nr:hypothetical protein T265_01178 [Opisthorchis viverrini]KER32897.1 hypothetical protein T265_01178 [Opisthorchis viverrini]OON21138.1 hypothetical protein X801_02972 [Opisthorchis viverrini]
MSESRAITGRRQHPYKTSSPRNVVGPLESLASRPPNTQRPSLPADSEKRQNTGTRSTSTSAVEELPAPAQIPKDYTNRTLLIAERSRIYLDCIAILEPVSTAVLLLQTGHSNANSLKPTAKGSPSGLGVVR